MIYMARIPQKSEKKHAAEHEAGESLLRYALREEYGMNWLPEITREKKGKPFFAEYPQIQFNISHSDGRVVCALGQIPLGIDVEYVRGVSDRLINRALTDSERSWLERSRDKQSAFIRLWNLKESFLKATGEGLRTELRAVEFLLPEEGQGGEILCNQKGASFFQRELPEKGYLALCVKGDRIPDELKKTAIVFL